MHEIQGRRSRIFKHTFKRMREFRDKQSLLTQAQKNEELYFFLSWKILKNAKVLFGMKRRGDRQEFFTVYERTSKNIYEVSWSLTFSKLFLFIAKNLTDRHWISWHKDKIHNYIETELIVIYFSPLSQLCPRKFKILS